MGAHLVSGTRVIKDNQEHFTPEVLVKLVIDESTEVATCLSEIGSCVSVVEECGNDEDLLDKFRRK